MPAIISLILFLVLTYVLIPLWQRYRNRYSQYLPVETISTQTSSLRARVQTYIGRMVVPSMWRRRGVVVADDDGSDAGFDSEDGEELGVVDEATRRRIETGAAGAVDDNTRRLSRE